MSQGQREILFYNRASLQCFEFWKAEGVVAMCEGRGPTQKHSIAHTEKTKSKKTHRCWRRRCLWAGSPWPWGYRCGSSRSGAPPAWGRPRRPAPSACCPSRPAGSRASAGRVHPGPSGRSYSTWQKGAKVQLRLGQVELRRLWPFSCKARNMPRAMADLLLSFLSCV